MKTRTLTTLISSLVLVGSLSGCGSPTASTGSAVTTDSAIPAATATATTTAPATTAAPEADVPTQIPAGGADEIWQAIDSKSAELDKAIHAGSLGNVHHMAFAIRDLVAALPERSGSLSADQKSKVQDSVKFVATLAERLDASGDAKDAVDTRANFDKLASVLADLRTNYSK